MQVNVNGKPVSCSDNCSVSKFLEEQHIVSENIALAINNKLVPKTVWTETCISDGDRILIIKAAQGG